VERKSLSIVQLRIQENILNESVGELKSLMGETGEVMKVDRFEKQTFHV